MSIRQERLRDRAYKRLKVILRFAEEINENTTIADIKIRTEELETKYQSFNEAELQLFEKEDYKEITEEVDEVYYKARSLLMQASWSRNQIERDNVQDLNTTLEQFIDQQKTFYQGINTSQHVRLPKINITPFSGDYKDWASFHDLFQTTVHSNPNITDVHKLQMLKGVLSGEAAALIRHISITENNYAEAWDKLCKRYNKMTPIVTSLIQTFMDQKANSKELRRLTETADEVIRGLRALGPNADKRDPWLIYILINKMDSETKQLWATESVNKEFPSFENLLEFLNKRCDALEICDVPAKRVNTKPTVKTFVIEGSSHRYECVACGQQHPLFRCPVFKNQSFETRSKLVTERICVQIV